MGYLRVERGHYWTRFHRSEDWWIEWNTLTNAAYCAVVIVARLAVVDPIAVADVEPQLGAVPPNRMLDEAGEGRREGRVEPPSIDLVGDGANHVGAAARPIAAEAVGMVRLEPSQNAGAMQKIVNQRIDGDHAAAHLDPAWIGGTEHQHRQGHAEDLVGHTVDMAQRFDQRGPHLGEPVGARTVIRRLDLALDPADKVAIGDIANEQVQRVGSLVEAAIAKVVAGEWAPADVVGFGASPSAFLEPAVMEAPVAAELGTARVVRKARLDQPPGRLAVLRDVTVRHLVRDALIAQGVDKPVEQGRRIVAADGGPETAVLGVDIVNESGRTGEATDAMNDPDRMLQRLA